MKYTILSIAGVLQRAHSGSRRTSKWRWEWKLKDIEGCALGKPHLSCRTIVLAQAMYRFNMVPIKHVTFPESEL